MVIRLINRRFRIKSINNSFKLKKSEKIISIMKTSPVINSEMLTYKTKLSSDNPKDLEDLREILVWHREVFNIAADCNH